MPTKSKDDLSLKVGKCLRALELGKKNYKKYDALMEILEVELEPGQIVQLGTGRKVRFVDRWAGKTRVNAGLNVRKFEFENVTEV